MLYRVRRQRGCDVVVRRLGVASCGLALVAALIVGGCTPDDGPTQSTSPSPAVSAAPSPSASPTPTENAQERQQRLDFEAAKTAYLRATAEADRLIMAGGARKPTKALLATTTGSYRSALMNAIRTFKENGWHSDRPIPQSVVGSGGWSSNELRLTACEDTSKVRYLNKQGKEVFKDRKRRYVHALTAERTGSIWRIATMESKAVTTFDHESCGA